MTWHVVRNFLHFTPITAQSEREKKWSGNTPFVSTQHHKKKDIPPCAKTFPFSSSATPMIQYTLKKFVTKFVNITSTTSHIVKKKKKFLKKSKEFFSFNDAFKMIKSFFFIRFPWQCNWLSFLLLASLIFNFWK